jgi:glyoxylase-like metal-dependent hydrolase (beta-lactamase superfamily II)
MILEKVVVGPLQTNCYILADETTKEAVIIDPGDDLEKITEIIDKNTLEPKAVLLTHDHFDHTGAFDSIRKHYQIDFPELKEGDDIQIGDIRIDVIETPGHSSNDLTYVVLDNIFPGDILFYRGIGRTDLEGGNNELIQKSLERLMNYPEDYNVYPGHGPETKIGEEKRLNPFINKE